MAFIYIRFREKGVAEFNKNFPPFDLFGFTRPLSSINGGFP
jgi:hypothetical protein